MRPLDLVAELITDPQLLGVRLNQDVRVLFLDHSHHSGLLLTRNYHVVFLADSSGPGGISSIAMMTKACIGQGD